MLILLRKIESLLVMSAGESGRDVAEACSVPTEQERKDDQGFGWRTKRLLLTFTSFRRSDVAALM
jgi:hypothetical protein